MDPHIRGGRSHDEQTDGNLYPEEEKAKEAVFGESFGTDVATKMRISRLYQRLEKRGEFAELDKAKRNTYYRNYLLANFEEEDGFGF